MKVCFVGVSLSMFSGTSKPIFELADKLSEKGIDITILTVDAPSNHKEIYNKYLMEEKSKKTKILTVSNPFLKRDILAKYDIIHGVDFLTLYGIKRFLHKSETSPRLIYSLTGSYKLHVEDLLNSGIASFLNIAKPTFIFKFLCPNMIFNKIFNDFDKIISTSDFMSRYLCTHGVAHEKIVKIPVGIDIDQFDRFNKTIQMLASYDYLYFGWGSSIRGVPDVLKAFSKVRKERPNARLSLFFLGSHGIEEKLYSYLIRKFNDFGHSVILNVGPQLNMLEIVKSANAVVLPFRSPFGYAHPPLVVLESMLLSKPVISTYMGSIPELITSGKTGFLVPPKDINALAQKMILTYDDKKLRRMIGDKAREHIINENDIKKITNRMIEVYDEVINGDG